MNEQVQLREKLWNILSGESQAPCLYVAPYNEALARLMRSGPFALGDAYVEGRWDSRELDSFLFHYFTSEEAGHARSGLRTILSFFLREILLNPQSGIGIFKVANEHYNLGNELFSAMLDSSMSYTCAIWQGAKSLQEAQEKKLERICRLLDLRPGMHILDIGCGWGNFAAYAAKKYRVSVTGLTVSKEQLTLARDKYRELPVEFRLMDYREMNGQFDAAVSIEMIEAVGRRNLRKYFESVHRNLKPGGRFVLQAICGETLTSHSHAVADQMLLWMERRIFPNGYVPRLDELAGATRGLFQMKELASFGADYDITLMAWLKNFRAAWPRLSSLYDEKFRRKWEYYLCSCAALFRAALADLHQIVYTKAE